MASAGATPNWCEIDWQAGSTQYQMVSSPALSAGLQGEATDKKCLSIGIVDGFSDSSVAMPGYLCACYTTDETKYGSDTGNTSVNGYTVNLTGKTGVFFNTLNVIYGSALSGASSAYNITNNTVNLQNVTFAAGNQIEVYGGQTDGTGAASNNTVAISGSSFSAQAMIIGGESENGNASGNTVTIADSEFKNNGEIYAAYAATDEKTSENNTLNLYGSVKGLTWGSLYGRQDDANGAGNELHLGGTKDGQTINGVAFAPWSDGVTGAEGNKVNRAYNFDKIVLHKVKWDTTTPVLQTTTTQSLGGFSAENFDATLDISDMTFDTETPSGTLTLLKSAKDNEFVARDGARKSALRLTYKDGNGTLHEDVSLGNGAITVKSVTGGTLAPAAAPGVTLGYDSTHKVALANTNKEVQYSVTSNYNTATLGAMEWGKGYAFASGAEIDSGGLAVTFADDFVVDGAASKAAGSSFDLLDLTSTSGALKAAVSKDVVVSMPEAAVTSALTINSTRTDTAAGEAGGTKVTYTVGSEKNVSSLVFDGAVAWSGEPHYDATGYTFTNSTAINATNLTFSGKANTALTTDGTSKMTLVSGATGLTEGQSITGGTGKTVGVDYTDAKGVNFDATATGSVTTAANAVNYTVSGVALNKVNLANWNGATDVLPTGWTGSGVAVETGSFAAPTDLAVGESRDIFTTNTTNFFGAVTGAKEYKENTFTNDEQNGVTLSGNKFGGVKATNGNKNLTYYAETMDTEQISLGEMTWNHGRAAAAGYDFRNVTGIDATNFRFSNPEAVTDNMTLLSGATNLAAGLAVTNPNPSQTFDVAANGATLTETLNGTIATTAGAVNYTKGDVTLDKVNLTGWNGTEYALSGVTANLGSNSITGSLAPNVDAGTTTNILTTTTDNFFNDNQIADAIKYKELASSPDTVNGVTLTGLESKGVKVSADGKSLVYERGDFNVNNIAFGEMTWGTARNASAAGYKYENTNVDLSKFTFTNPETISAGTTTLLEANDTLAEIAATEKNLSYTYTPVSGVRLDGIINGSYATTDAHALQYTATANQATKLTFGDVAWKDSGALMTRPANITFAGADVDTTNIKFTNIQSLEANKKMTLVSDFGNSVGTITGAKYKVGSTLEGEGKASLVGNDLIFTAETGTGGKPDVEPQEQTHNTVMGAEVGMATLSAGNDFVGTATEGLAMAANVGADGVSSFANMGGGSIRQETGSHIDAHTWNAIIALGHANKKERGTFEYGAFFEYGTGNYTTHNGDERGDGSTHYTGGGLLAKWTVTHGLYVEGSLRAGSVHDDARNVLRDGNGVPYSYETNAPYFGGHIGVGKEITLNNGNVVDVYGKYFYNRRNGVSFDAGGHYDLDAVTSQVVRVGARYTVKRDKWNFYGGLAYEHELDGKESGTADGVAIRGADTSGGSLRGEIGATMKPGENSPITLDFNVTGFAGKKQGFSGGVSVALMF